MTRTPSQQLVVFALAEKLYAVRLEAVQRIVRMVAVETLPRAPAIVLGVVNVGGRLVPVVDLRARFRLPPRAIDPDQQLVIARTSRRWVAFSVDAVSGITEVPEGTSTAPGAIVPGLEYVSGVVKLDGGMVFVHDLDTFLSLEETETLEQALAPAGGVR